MITVTSTFAGTVRSLADANGPYIVDAGAPLTLTGGPNNASTTFAWDFADGATANTRVAQHTYPRTVFLLLFSTFYSTTALFAQSNSLFAKDVLQQCSSINPVP